MTTIRQATVEVMRHCGMTRVFANPGSSEVAFLADLPDDFEFYLGLHEATVVGMATGHAIATERPAFVNLHTTAGHDAALVVGTAALRQYHYEPGPLSPAGTTVVVVSDDPDELHHSQADLAVLADPAALCVAIAARLPHRHQTMPPRRPSQPVPPPAGDHVMRAAHVFAALAERLPRDVVLVEETPSTRPDLHRLLPAREPRGFVSAAMGGLGFGLPAAAGLI